MTTCCGDLSFFLCSQHMDWLGMLMVALLVHLSFFLMRLETNLKIWILNIQPGSNKTKMSLYWINANPFRRSSSPCPWLDHSQGSLACPLECHFASLSQSHIIQIKTQLQSIKKGDMTMTENVQKIKHTSYSLASSVSSRRWRFNPLHLKRTPTWLCSI